MILFRAAQEVRFMKHIGGVIKSKLAWCLLIAVIVAGLEVLIPPSNANANWKDSWTSSVSGQDSDAAEVEVQKGTDLLRRGRYEDALKSFKRANDMRNKKCPECLYGMSQAYYGLDAHKNAVESTDKLIALATNDKKLLLYAYNVKGLSLQALADFKDQKKLAEAEAVFRSGVALDIDGLLPIFHYNLGFTLMLLNRDPEGIAEMKKFLEAESEGTYAERAAKIIENPRRAREPYAPEFSITTAEGEHIASEDLRGKVIVLDFWGTWCPPCVASLPSLRSLHKKFSKEPSFVLIGVSSDSDEDKWKEFTASEKMVWPQYLDANRAVQRAFGVRAFPTYIVIDHEGIIRFRSSGTSWERSANLNDAIKKYVKLVAKTDAAAN
jgi:peroxiredoxin